MTKIRAEIMYIRQADGIHIHSDIEQVGCGTIFTDEYKEFLHTCLDEWLENSGGTGAFYIKKEGLAIDGALDGEEEN